MLFYDTINGDYMLDLLGMMVITENEEVREGIFDNILSLLIEKVTWMGERRTNDRRLFKFSYCLLEEANKKIKALNDDKMETDDFIDKSEVIFTRFILENINLLTLETSKIINRLYLLWLTDETLSVNIDTEALLNMATLISRINNKL